MVILRVHACVPDLVYQTRRAMAHDSITKDGMKRDSPLSNRPQVSDCRYHPTGKRLRSGQPTGAPDGPSAGLACREGVKLLNQVDDFPRDFLQLHRINHRSRGQADSELFLQQVIEAAHRLLSRNHVERLLPRRFELPKGFLRDHRLVRPRRCGSCELTGAPQVLRSDMLLTLLREGVQELVRLRRIRLAPSRTPILFTHFPLRRPIQRRRHQEEVLDFFSVVNQHRALSLLTG